VFLRCKLSTEELMPCLFHTRAIRYSLQTKKKFSRFWPSKQLHHLESVGEDQRIRRIRVARPVPLIDQICRLLIVNVNPVYPGPI
jgi:hypothetical protein